MKIPKRLHPLIEDGLINEIICQLQSGKEAQVYMVRCGGTVRCAKVYKEAKFNVLVDQHCPVIIDLPQAVNAAGNNNAPMMLSRSAYFGRYAPELLSSAYAKDIWAPLKIHQF